MGFLFVRWTRAMREEEKPGTCRPGSGRFLTILGQSPYSPVSDRPGGKRGLHQSILICVRHTLFSQLENLQIL